MKIEKNTLKTLEIQSKEKKQTLIIFSKKDNLGIFLSWS